MFTTALKNIFEVARYADDVVAFSNCLKNDERYKHLDEETIQIMNNISNIKVEVIEGEGNMCKAFEDYRLQGKVEGKIEGQKTLLTALVKDGDITIEKAATRLNISTDEFKKMMEE